MNAHSIQNQMQKMKPVFPSIFENVTNFEIPAHPKILGYLEMNNEYNIHICKQSAIRVATNFSVGKGITNERGNGNYQGLY